MLVIHLFNVASQFVWDIFKVVFLTVFLLVVAGIVLAIAGLVTPFICAIAAKRMVFPPQHRTIV